MAETEIPQDVMEAAGRFADEIETTRDGFRTGRWLLIRNMQVDAIMADRASHAPDRDVLVEALRELMEAYRSTLETGRLRIIDLGGTCDPVDVMVKGDPALIRARAAIEARAITTEESRNAE